MLTYQVRPRVFKISNSGSLNFPDKGKVKFHFSPLQPFGMEAGGGHTAVRAVKAKAIFNANTGEHTIESDTPLNPLDVIIEAPNRNIQLNGNILTISQTFNSNQELTELIEGVYFGVPALLSVEFADPPYIERVEGELGKSNFRWELSDWKMDYQITTQEEQEQKIFDSWESINLISNPGRRRLLAALHYLYVALRLSRESSIAGEFLPEVILNFSKILEVLFPPAGDGRTRDAARAGLTSLGFSEDEVEGDYIPAMALRNEIDVGHVDLSIFTKEQLTIIHGYSGRAEHAFRLLLSRVLDKIKNEEFDVDEYDIKPAEKDAVYIVDRLRKYADRYSI